MKCETLFEAGDHRWTYFGQDPARPAGLVDTNQIVIASGDSAVLVDPGGAEIFSEMLPAVLTRFAPTSLKHVFLSHQDPDVASSLGLWRSVASDQLKIYISAIWAPFVAHFDAKATLTKIPDEGMEIRVSRDVVLQAIAAHYLHSSGNFHLYDPAAKILFSGDVGAAILPSGAAAKGIYVQDFNGHTLHMDTFHRRWMGSEAAKMRWVERVSRLEIDMLVPQHGLIFRGDDVKRFIDWFARLPIGSAVNAIGREGR